jgi:hypothetical protein
MKIIMESVDQEENFGLSNLSRVREDERCSQRFINNCCRPLLLFFRKEEEILNCLMGQQKGCFHL